MKDSNYYPEDIRKEIASNLKQGRITNGKSQSYVADKLGVTQASIALYESGKSAIPAEVIYWYALNFKLELNAVFGLARGYNFEKEIEHQEYLNIVYREFDDPTSEFAQLLEAKIEEALNNQISKKKK